MIIRQHTLIRNGLDAALSCVGGNVKQAFEKSHERLAEMGIPHVLVGGLAVGSHGHQYATTDVDWLVPDSAFEGGLVVTFRPGMPIRVADVAVDFLVPGGPPSVMAAMQEALAVSAASLDRVFVASEELLVWMKLKAGRPKDMVAITELLRAGQMDVEAVHDFLIEAGDALVLKRFARATEETYAEE
jgi:hypothetical protein